MPSPPQTTSASTPSATHWRARSSASSASRPCQVAHAPVRHSRRRASATSRARAPLPLPDGRVGEQGDLPRTGRRAADYRASEHVSSAEAQQHGERAGSARRPPSRAGRAPPATSSAVNDGAGHREGQPAVVRHQEHLAVPPGLVGLVPRARRRPPASGRPRRPPAGRRAAVLPSPAVSAPATWWPSCDAAVGRPGHLALPQPVGRSNGSTSPSHRESGGDARRRAHWSVRFAPRPRAPVDDARDDLGDDEQHQHRDGQHQHRERVGRRRRHGGEDEDADHDPRPVAAQGLARTTTPARLSRTTKNGISIETPKISSIRVTKEK